MTSGRVTQKDLYESISDLKDAIDVHFEKMRCEMLDCYNNNAKRISSLEIWRAEIMGKVAIVAGCISVLFLSVWEWIRRKIFD